MLIHSRRTQKGEMLLMNYWNAEISKSLCNAETCALFGLVHRDTSFILVSWDGFGILVLFLVLNINTQSIGCSERHKTINLISNLKVVANYCGLKNPNTKWFTGKIEITLAFLFCIRLILLLLLLLVFDAPYVKWKVSIREVAVHVLIRFTLFNWPWNPHPEELLKEFLVWTS